MSNVLSDDKKQQVIALGKLGWTLRRIEQATGVRRETASNYLKAAESSTSCRRVVTQATVKINEVTTDSDSKPAMGRGDHRLYQAF
jgi:hypothetical protein